VEGIRSNPCSPLCPRSPAPVVPPCRDNRPPSAWAGGPAHLLPNPGKGLSSSSALIPRPSGYGLYARSPPASKDTAGSLVESVVVEPTEGMPLQREHDQATVRRPSPPTNING